MYICSVDIYLYVHSSVAILSQANLTQGSARCLIMRNAHVLAADGPQGASNSTWCKSYQAKNGCDARVDCVDAAQEGTGLPCFWEHRIHRSDDSPITTMPNFWKHRVDDHEILGDVVQTSGRKRKQLALDTRDACGYRHRKHRHCIMYVINIYIYI